MFEFKILFVDDEETAREVARYNLTRAGFEVDTAESAEAALKRFEAAVHPVVVTDLRLPGMDGLGLMQAVKERSPDVAVVVVTAFGDIETAVKAMRQGAYDFIAKPFNREQLELTVCRAIERATLLAENRRLIGEGRGVERPIIYRSEIMRQTLALVDRVGRSDSTALITGESGTGKELIARRLHTRSSRADKNFVAINCAAIPSELMESEFFGHEAGSFTGAQRKRKGRFLQADGGTLFLDEVAEIPLSLQGKLLRVLQEGEVDPVGADRPVKVDARLVVATNQRLRDLVERGVFRQDLYYRLNVLEIRLPALRERVEDIPLLARHFVEMSSGDRLLTIPEGLLSALMKHDWPGNVRELQNACERLSVLCTGEELRVQDLPPGILDENTASKTNLSEWLRQRPRGLSLFDMERLMIEHTLKEQEGNLSGAARELGVPRHILAYRVEKFGILLDKIRSE